MKRFFVVLLAAGLIIAFGTPAFAVDVKISGKFEAEGWYDSNRTLREDSAKAAATGLFDQRLRMYTVFKVSDDVSLSTRFTALEKIWGDKTTGLGGTAGSADTWGRLYSTNRALKENIEFERASVTFKALYGKIDAGYMQKSLYGPTFGDTDETAPIIKYTYYTGPWSISAAFEKSTENQIAMTNGTATAGAAATDVDYDQWKLNVGYKWAGGDAGIAETYYTDKTARTAATAYSVQYHRLNPYVRATLGPIYVEGEVQYMTGDYRNYENGGSTNIKKDGWAWYLNAKYTMGPVYIGGQYSFVAGDDPSTADKNEAGYASGQEYKPCLILLNSDRDEFLGSLGSSTGGGMTMNNYSGKGSTNFNLYQVYAGFKPFQKLDLFASYSIATLDKKPSGYTDDKIGNEFDITATYKIFDNLTYMAGLGYLWAGDAWKGSTASNQVSNDWLLMHKLTLNF